jgi:hypothetical protein
MLQVWNFQISSTCQIAAIMESNHQSFCMNPNVAIKASTSLFPKAKDAIMCNDNTAQ